MKHTAERSGSSGIDCYTAEARAEGFKVRRAFQKNLCIPELIPQTALKATVTMLMLDAVLKVL